MVHRLTNSAAAEMIDRCARCKSSSHLKKSLPLLFQAPSTIFPKGFEDVGANILTKNVHTAVRCTYDCVYRICCYNYGHAQGKYCESMAHLDRCIGKRFGNDQFWNCRPMLEGAMHMLTVSNVFKARFTNKFNLYVFLYNLLRQLCCLPSSPSVFWQCGQIQFVRLTHFCPVVKKGPIEPKPRFYRTVL